MVIYFAHINLLFSLGDFDTFPITEIYVRDIRLEEFQDFNRILHKDLRILEGSFSTVTKIF